VCSSDLTSRLMLGMGNGNVNEDSDDQSQQSSPFAGVIFTIEHFIKNFSRINWSATAQALLKSLAPKQKSKKRPATSDQEQSQIESEPTIAPSIKVSPVSEDAEIQEWLNSITEKAARSSSKSKAPAKKPSAKKAAVTKKASPKSTNKRK